ncbi:hypothetical protein ACLOJK_027099 [Asimina triloba]
MIIDLLFNGGGADDLNVDNIDRALRLPDADAPILSGSFFALASSGCVERSPPSIHRGSSSGEGEIEGPAHRRVSFSDDAIDLASKSIDDVSGGVAKCVASIEGRAAEVVVLDSDEGSGGNYSVG